MTSPPETFVRLERQLGRLLITGVAISAALLSLGLLLQIVAPGRAASAHLLAAGLVILMATPMLRVIVSIIEYVRMGEWLFVLTTIVVFVELTVGVTYALLRR